MIEDKIREVLFRKGLYNRSELSRRTGINYQTLRNIEQHPLTHGRLADLIRIANVVRLTDEERAQVLGGGKK